MKPWTSIVAGAVLAFGVGTASAARTDLVLGVVLEPPHLDPTAHAAAAIDEILYANVFEGLTRIGSKGEVLPDLAETWSISDDGKVYTFRLRSGVKFHDGTTFDSADVKFSLDRARAPDSTNAQKGLFAQIDTVEAVDPTTVRVTLKKPQGAFLYNMGWGDAVIVAPESAATNKEKPIGTGPFKFESWAKGSSVKLSKSGDYWGQAAALDRVEFRFIPDPAAAVPALLAGDVQAFPSLPPDALAQVQGDARFTVKVGATQGETILTMNNRKAPFDKIEVRQAISYALDRKAIVDGASAGLGVPIGSFFSPADPAYVDLTGTYPHDVAKAKELLKAAGLENGFNATIKLPPPSYARLGGEIIASQLREVGINLQIIPVDFPVWLEQVFRGKDFDLTIISHTEPNDIDVFARKDYYIGYDSPAFDKIIAELSVTSDADKRKQLLGEAQRILAHDAPVGFLFELPKVGVWDAKLSGFWENSPIQANDLTKVKWSD